jgi:hypothetical protein
MKKSKIEKKRTSFFLPKELADKLAAYAHANNITQSAVITGLLVELFGKQKLKPLPPKKTVDDIMKK